jgi:transcriptional regulator with XRE-family HTH domain
MSSELYPYVAEPMRLPPMFSTVLLLPTLGEMRAALRDAREGSGKSLDKLSEDSGVDRTAIHKIENPEKYPDYEPGLDTFRRLVEATGLTMQAFFWGLEALGDQPRHVADQRSGSHQEVTDALPAASSAVSRFESIRERDRSLASEVRNAIRALTSVAVTLEEETGSTPSTAPRRPRRDRKTG